MTRREIKKSTRAHYVHHRQDVGNTHSGEVSGRQTFGTTRWRNNWPNGKAITASVDKRSPMARSRVFVACSAFSRRPCGNERGTGPSPGQRGDRLKLDWPATGCSCVRPLACSSGYLLLLFLASHYRRLASHFIRPPPFACRNGTRTISAI